MKGVSCTGNQVGSQLWRMESRGSSSSDRPKHPACVLDQWEGTNQVALGGDGNLAQICTGTQQIWEHRPERNKSEHNVISSYGQYLDDMMLGGGH